jgi:hypothetical protein
MNRRFRLVICLVEFPLVAAADQAEQRAVAQLGSALDWGSRGREFKSRQPDKQNTVDSERSTPRELQYRRGRLSPSYGSERQYSSEYSNATA